MLASGPTHTGSVPTRWVAGLLGSCVVETEVSSHGPQPPLSDLTLTRTGDSAGGAASACHVRATIGAVLVSSTVSAATVRRIERARSVTDGVTGRGGGAQPSR